MNEYVNIFGKMIDKLTEGKMKDIKKHYNINGSKFIVEQTIEILDDGGYIRSILWTENQDKEMVKCNETFESGIGDDFLEEIIRMSDCRTVKEEE